MTALIHILRHPLLGLALAIATLAGCASVGSPGGNAGPPAIAPDYRVGDRWVYQGEEGYLAKSTWEETHEIISIGPDGITVRVTVKGERMAGERTEKWSAPGVVLVGAVYENETDRFDPALLRYKYPLAAGDAWNQRVRDLNKPPGPYGPIVRHVTVGGYETVTTTAGTFDAIRLRVIMQLDDETFWRYATECNDLIWYAPAIGAVVREQKRSQWRDKGDEDGTVYHPGQLADVRLVSYTRGR